MDYGRFIFLLARLSTLPFCPSVSRLSVVPSPSSGHRCCCPSAALPASVLIWGLVSDRVSDHHLWVWKRRDPRRQGEWKPEGGFAPSRKKKKGRLPCAVHGDYLLVLFFSLTYIPPLLSSLSSSTSSTPRRPSAMSHDETHTHYLPPYYSPAPSSDTGSSDHKEDGPFDPGNTPPLIFAFIAVGFIIFGAIVAVIYKKYRPLPNSRDPHQRSSVPSRRSSIQKPRLWDVWIAPNQPPAFDEERTKPNDWDTFVVSRTLCTRRLSSIGRLISTRSLYQRRLYTLTLPLPPFVSPNNTSKAMLQDLFPGRTRSIGCFSDTLRRTQLFVPLS